MSRSETLNTEGKFSREKFVIHRSLWLYKILESNWKKQTSKLFLPRVQQIFDGSLGDKITNVCFTCWSCQPLKVRWEIGLIWINFKLWMDFSGTSWSGIVACLTNFFLVFLLVSSTLASRVIYFWNWIYNISYQGLVLCETWMLSLSCVLKW